MRTFDRFKAAFKSFPFNFNWVDSNRPGNLYSTSRGSMYWIPGSRFNWDCLTGHLWSCPAVQACLNWILRNYGQAPPVIREKVNGAWQDDPTHPLLTLLSYPNPAYDGSVLTQGIIMSLELNGNAYVVIERTQGGEIKELWWVPHHWVTPYTEPGSKTPMIVDEYRIQNQSYAGREVRVPPADMIHLTYVRDPMDPRLGLSPLVSLTRDINLLQQLSVYKPSIVRNFGVIGKFVSPKDNTVEVDPAELKAKLDAQTQGDNVGSTVVSDFAVNVDYPHITPKDLDAGGMGDMSECNICACMGLHPQLVSLYSGRLHKTDASIKEHREEAWEGKLIPLGALIACQLGNRLLVEFAGSSDPVAIAAYQARYRMEYDYSRIRPLQPPLAALNRRELLLFQAGITTAAEFCEATGRPKPKPEIADLYWQDINPAPVTSNGLAIGSEKPTNGTASSPSKDLSLDAILNGRA